jgi:hypothetical protein
LQLLLLVQYQEAVDGRVSCFIFFFMFYHVLSCFIMLYHVLSCFVMFYHVLSGFIMFYHGLSCFIMSYQRILQLVGDTLGHVWQCDCFSHFSALFLCYIKRSWSLATEIHRVWFSYFWVCWDMFRSSQSPGHMVQSLMWRSCLYPIHWNRQIFPCTQRWLWMEQGN